MKKQIIILFLFAASFSSRSQERIFLKGPCTQSICDNANGKWIKSGDDISPYLKFSKQQQQEALKRFYEIQDLIFKMYPEPKGVDVVWGTTLGNGYFGSSAKYSVKDNRITFDYLKEVLTPSMKYACSFPSYYCANDKENSMWAGYTNETGTFIKIFANDFQWFAGTPQDDSMTVNQLQVKMKHHVKEMWKGCELMDAPSGGNIRYVLISRKGMLPYRPVTRKQYLNYYFNYVTKSYDKMMADIDAYQPDKEQRNHQKEGIVKLRNNALRSYQDEVEKTTAAGLLDSPAIVVSMTPGLAALMSPGGKPQIFITEEEGGQMLVTENPAYMRKDLPKYVPQFFVIAWAWESPLVPSENIRKIIEKNFPVEQLQAMIDK